MKEKILMIIFVLLLGSILTGILVAVNFYTSPLIEKNSVIKLKTSVLKAVSILFSEEEVEKVFADNIRVKGSDENVYYLTANEEVAFPFSGPGLWGQITGILAMHSDLSSIKGITIIYQEETPGLGSRIAEKEYLDIFNNKKFAPDLIAVGAGKSSRENEIDTITGATMSSNAFIKILNMEYKKYRSFIQGD